MSIKYKQIFLDFDSTVSKIEGIDVLSDIQKLQGVQEITKQEMEGQIDLKGSYLKRAQQLSFHPPHMNIVSDVYIANLYPDVQETINVLKYFDKEVVVVSGGFYEAIEPVCKHLGIDTLYAIKTEGGLEDSVLMEPQGKCEIVKKHKTGNSVFIGDGVTDESTKDVVERMIPFAGVEKRQWMESTDLMCYSGKSFLGLLCLILDEEEFSIFQKKFPQLSEKALASCEVENPSESVANLLERGIKHYHIPGPTSMQEDIRNLSFSMISHRSPEFMEIYDEVQKELKRCFKTDNEFLTACSSATGMMEAISNTLPEGAKVLSLQSGDFGKRFSDVAKKWKLNVTDVCAEYGKAITLEDLEKYSDEHFDAVFIVQSETSSGTNNDIKKISEYLKVKNPDIWVFVDAVTGAFSTPIDMSLCDGYFFGSQKCLNLDPGISFLCISPKFEKYIDLDEGRGYYFNLKICLDRHRLSITQFTPAVGIFQKLEYTLKKHFADIDQVHKRYRDISERIWKFCDDEGLKMYCERDSRTLGATCIELPKHKPNLLKELRKRGVVIASGYKVLKKTHFRISHMGSFDMDELEEMLKIFKEVLETP